MIIPRCDIEPAEENGYLTHITSSQRARSLPVQKHGMLPTWTWLSYWSADSVLTGLLRR